MDPGDAVAFALERHARFAGLRRVVVTGTGCDSGFQLAQGTGSLGVFSNEHAEIFSPARGGGAGRERDERLTRERGHLEGAAEADKLARASFKPNNTVTRRLASEVGGSSAMGTVSA